MVLVEGRRWYRESCLVVGNMLGPRSLLNGTVEHVCDDGAPEQDCKTKCAKYGSHDNEDGAVGQAGNLHVGRVRSGRHARGGVSWNGSVPAAYAAQGRHVRLDLF